MSDQSEQEDDLASDVIAEQDSDESETDQSGTDQGDGFLDIEAEESDGDEEDEDEDDYHFDDGDDFSFPQFSRLPPELRVMIWEAVDPHLKSKGRVLDFYVHNIKTQVDLWESATLSHQTAPARALLATNKESRCIALQHYPDAIQLRGGLGDVRFNSSNDIIFLRKALPVDYFDGVGLWTDRIKYLALEYSCTQSPEFYPFFYPDGGIDIPQAFSKLEAVIYCFDSVDLDILGHRALDWSVSELSKQFYIETFEEHPGLGEDYKALYCWPDMSRHANYDDRVGKDFPIMPAMYDIPIWPMAQYSFDSGLELYHRAKRFYEKNIGREAGSASFLESSEGESVYESEPDDYALDDFVVDGSSEGDEESSDDDEGEGVNIHGPHDSGDYGNSSGEDGGEDDARFDQNLDAFNGFSPLQEDPSDGEATGNLPNATSVIYDLEPPEDHLSNASSPEEQPRTITQTGRRKRHIVSSDDEDGGEDGGGSTAETHSRVKKRARVILSDSEDEEGGGENGARSETEVPSRLKKRARIVLSDSEDGEDEGHSHNEGPKPLGNELDENEDEDDENDGVSEDEDTEDDDEDEEEPPVSKPTSLLARLRQFRSDVPIPPEGESSNSDGEFDEEEQYDDDEGRRLSDAEFPESAGEDGEGEGW
ncbi:hypothetical protein E0Z10_g9224 [Xylaria hypoxylon]|uniref:2EXR domain-containing protein n=1 Tax=Xylaria hypoxylon TaxID=37992 RepID=A0A4Z0YPL7_9PEZI|nr:hypothetical protein E0Z10_g9224 [Xylaria hypoxylon]